MLGFKRFDHAAIPISGIELAEKIKKAVQNRQAQESDSNDVGGVECGACRLTITGTQKANSSPSQVCTTAVFLGDQFPMPSQQGLGCDNAGDLGKNLSSQHLAFTADLRR
jgi:hypothetical protein